MKKLFTIAAILVLGVGIFIGWGPISEVSAQIRRYFAINPDVPPSMAKKAGIKEDGEGEGKGADEADYIARRDAFVNLLRGVDPERPADPASRSRAVTTMEGQQDRMVAARNKNGSSFISDALLAAWTELGPNPIPNGQTQTITTPVSGRVTAIAIDPTDPNKVYVGAAQGGVYRSLDGGATWTPIFDGAQTLAIGSLTLDAANNRLWVGTGEPNGSADSFAGVGIYRVDSPATTATLVGPFNPVRNYTDAGSVAQSVPAVQGRSVSKILINPANANELLVGSAGGVIGLGGNTPFGGAIPPLGLRGLYKFSNVGGAPASATVTRIAVSVAGGCFDIPCTGNRNVNDMVFDLSDPTGNTLILWLNGISAVNDGGIYRSTNALGASPTFTQTFITPSSSGRGAFAIAQLGVGTPARIYVASGEPSTSGSLCNSAAQAGGLRRSIDGGATWSAELPGGGGFCSGQCFYNIAFEIVAGATSATDKLFLGGNVQSASCQKLQGTSLDGAATVFANTDVGLHADSHVIKVAPSNSNIVYRGDDGGIWKSTNGGATWASLNNATFRATQFQSIAVHPTDPNFTIGGTQDNGTENLLPAGTSWNRIDFGDGGFALIDQNATDNTNVVMYHTYFNQTNNLIGVARTNTVPCASDGQWSFHGIYGGAVGPTPYCDGSTDTFSGIAITDSVNFYAPIALGPGNPNTVYFGSNKLYRSINKGDTMTIASQTMASNVSSIAISPQDDNYRFVGLNNGGLFFTTTGGNPLTSLDPVGGATVIPDFYVARLAFDPTNKNTVYISLGNYAAGTAAAQSHVWKVTNLGTTPVITAVNGSGATGLPDVPVNSFAIDPQNGSNLFAGTDIGVYASRDAGLTWVPFGTGLPRVAVFDMAVAPGRTLRIATHGRGMWQIPLLAPTAASVSISGRVMTAQGRGLRNAFVTLTDSHGVMRQVMTSIFGTYRFDDVQAGDTYSIGVRSRRFSFQPQVLNVTDNLSDIDFIAQ